jgi:hypothetical protein
MNISNAALSAVVGVGGGRGFVVERQGRFGSVRYVITAAHCLPERSNGQALPPAHGFSYTEERTYMDLLAPLGKEPSVWCECLFVDPIADIAVLGAADNQELAEQAEAYEALVEAAIPLKIAEPPGKPIAEEVKQLKASEKRFSTTGMVQWARRECPGFMLSLDNQWLPCVMQYAPTAC